MKPLKQAAEPLRLPSGIILPSAILPAPMEGIMSPVFCYVAHQLDLVDMWITPFIRISTAVPKPARLRRKLEHFSERGLPLIVQLLGTNPELLAEAAQKLSEIEQVIGINLNFACPSKTVLQSGGGGKLLDTPDQIAAILSRIHERCPQLSLSAKIRMGFSSPTEAGAILDACLSVPLDLLMVHFRTVAETYRPVPNGVQRLVDIVEKAGSVPVLGSGDIFGPEDARRHLDAGCAGVIAARGLIKDPFVVRRLQGRNCPAREEAGQRFLREVVRLGRDDMDTHWSRPGFLELAAHIWGTSHPLFIRFRTADDETIFNDPLFR